MEDQLAQAAESAADTEEMGTTSIELKIKQDGSMVVCMEANDAEEGEQETPARDLNDALRIIKQIAEGVMGQAQAPAAREEQAAFEQEMAG